MMVTELPQFANIVPDKILPMLQEILRDNLNKLETQDLSRPIEVLESIENRLHQFWSPIAHLHAVRSTPELREAYKACLPLLSDYETAISHHEKLYQAFRQYQPLNSAEKRIIELKLRDFRLSGIDLSAEKKTRYGEIEKKLSELGAQFSENILDATQAWSYLASDQELIGIPQEIIPQDKKLTLDYPCYSAVQKYAENRALREKCYVAYVTRASELNHNLQYDNTHDNTEIMQQILSLKYELAELLGFKNYAELSLATKMAKSSDQVLDFLDKLVEHAKPAAQKELSELTDFAEHILEPWDIAFYSEKLSQQRYQIHQELFRPYFPVDHVLSGLFSLVSQLYGLSIQKLENIETWNPEVVCFGIYNSQQKLLGIFYMDLYTRKLKREGAWMDDYCSRYQKSDGELQIPVAYLTCNFHQTRLLTHDDAMTLFHEFGHGLHHLLTTIDHIDIAGIHGVPWDAVELPSQFMENFCWEKSLLQKLSKHHQTGEVLPAGLIDNLLASRHFNAGLQLLRQLEFGLFDFHLHLVKPIMNAEDKNKVQDKNKNFVLDLSREIHGKTAVITMPEYSRFPHTFSHIFDGGYSAAYYSYLWAEVLSCDVFSLFEENGILDTATGKKFLDTLLSQGGSQPPEILFKNFRGREPNQQAFLKSWGLIK